MLRQAKPRGMKRKRSAGGSAGGKRRKREEYEDSTDEEEYDVQVAGVMKVWWNSEFYGKW